ADVSSVLLSTGRWRATRRIWRQRIPRLQRTLRGLLARFGELHGPGALLAGIDFEEAGAVEAAGEAIADALDGEFLVARAHESVSGPFAAAVVVDGVEIVVAGNQTTLEQAFAGPRRNIPPALGGPALAFLVAHGDADAAAGVVADAEIGGRRARRGHQREHEHCADCQGLDGRAKQDGGPHNRYGFGV